MNMPRESEEEGGSKVAGNQPKNPLILFFVLVVARMTCTSKSFVMVNVADNL